MTEDYFLKRNSNYCFRSTDAILVMKSYHGQRIKMHAGAKFLRKILVLESSDVYQNMAEKLTAILRNHNELSFL